MALEIFPPPVQRRVSLVAKTNTSTTQVPLLIPVYRVQLTPTPLVEPPRVCHVPPPKILLTFERARHVCLEIISQQTLLAPTACPALSVRLLLSLHPLPAPAVLLATTPALASRRAQFAHQVHSHPLRVLPRARNVDRDCISH